MQHFHAKNFKQQFVSHSLYLKVFKLISTSLVGSSSGWDLSLLIETNKYRLKLFTRVFEESPAWFCSHLLAMIQSCSYDSVMFVKPQQ